MMTTNTMMLIFGLTLFIFGLIVTLYTRTRLRHLGVSGTVEAGITKPSLSAIIRRNRLRSWKSIALVVALIGVLLTLLSLI